MKYITLITILCTLFSCRNKDDGYASLIKGYWIGPDSDTTYPKKFISFADSFCHISIRGTHPLKYEVRKNILYLESMHPESEGQFNKYAIVKLTSDSLILFRDTAQHGTLRFVKIRPKNNITPTAIYFTSSGCFGSCPVMDLSIDSSRNIHFYGEHHTSISGGYSGRISQSEYNTLIGYVRNLPIDSLKAYYEADWTDDQSVGISIVYGNKAIKSAAYGNYKEPVELRLLMNKLMSLYKNVNLQPDSSIKKRFTASVDLTQYKVSLPPQPEQED